MFDNTMTVTVAPGDSLTLVRINQDNFGSEYRFADANRYVRLRIRHSEENPPKGTTLKYLRHNVLLEYNVAPTPTALPQTYTVTLTVRHQEFAIPALAASLLQGLTNRFDTDTMSTRFIAGES